MRKAVRWERVLFTTLFILLSLFLSSCGGTPSPDIEATIQVGIAATLTAQPTDTSMPRATPASTETLTPTPSPPFAYPSPGKNPSPFVYSLNLYEGPGFSFLYPPNARVEKVEPTSPARGVIRIIGPIVWVKPGDGDWSYNGPAYELSIVTFEKPKEVENIEDLEGWVRALILKEWKEAQERNEPAGSLPVTGEGVIDEKRIGKTFVAGQPAFWVNYFGFDHNSPTFYLICNEQIVELSFDDYPLANQPLAAVQQDVYALIMGTFQCLNSENTQ